LPKAAVSKGIIGLVISFLREPKFVAALISRGTAYYAKGDYDRAATNSTRPLDSE